MGLLVVGLVGLLVVGRGINNKHRTQVTLREPRQGRVLLTGASVKYEQIR